MKSSYIESKTNQRCKTTSYWYVRCLIHLQMKCIAVLGSLFLIHHHLVVEGH